MIQNSDANWTYRARVIGPLGELGGFDVGMSVGRAVSGHPPWERVILDSCVSISSSPWYGERSATLKVLLTKYMDSGMLMMYVLLLMRLRTLKRPLPLGLSLELCS